MLAAVIIVLGALLLLAGVLYLRYRLRLPLPVVDGTLTAPGLHEAVEVIRDSGGVPHIYASSLEDLLLAQGFVQAQDRLWQMELNRRLARGRLSEVFGRRTLDTDRFTRTIGIARAAERDLACLSERSRLLLDAFVRGVNAFLDGAGRRLPLEFVLLGFTPEPWTPLDSLAWIRMQAWHLSANWSTEILNAALVGRVGPQRAARLFGGYPEENPPILAEQTVIRTAEQALKAFETLSGWFPAEALAGRSNCWAVGGGRSESGKALFAYDPHLGLTVPGLWHACHLVCPDLEATGATFPGVPGVIVGHNREIAFGFTNAFTDVQDLYLERFNPENPLEYEAGGRWIPVRRIVEEIRIKGESDPLPLEVIATRHGPVVGDLLRLRSADKSLGYALRWAGAEGSDPLAALIAMDRAENWEQFCTAMSLWATPSQNAVYADRRGNIGYALNGRIPIRRRGIGLVPVPGWTDEHEWSGWIPWEQMPREYNPKRGYVVSANNQIAGREYPHPLGIGTANGNRAARIVELIESREKHSVADFAAMQTDLLSRPARRFALLCTSLAGGILGQESLREVREQAGAALGLLKGWDGVLAPGSAAAAVYSPCEYHVKRELFGPWLGDLTEHYCGRGVRSLGSISYYLDYSHLVALEVLEREEDAWLTTPEGRRRSREQVLARALKQALRFLSSRYGRDPRRWRYGDFHRAWFIHPIGSRRPFHLLFNSKDLPLGGSADTVWQCPPLRSLPPQKSSYSASWRQLVDFADLDGALWTYAGGQSGHPASRHYRDLIPLWACGRHRSLLWSRESIEADAEARLTLVPD